MVVRSQPVVFLGLLIALADPPSGSSNVDGGGSETIDAAPRANPDATVADLDGDGVPDSTDNCPALASDLQLDGDGYGDDCDSANSQIAADRVLLDALDADRGQLSPAPGFPATSWSYGVDGYQQNRLDDDDDDAAIVASEPITDVLVALTASSTNVNGFDGDDLRQLFVTARANSSAAAFEAIG